MEKKLRDFRTIPNIVDHLQCFLSVYDEGGFTAAARVLGRAVSSISYSVSQLEAACGFPLLERGAGPVELTERGRALYAEGRSVIEAARRFSAHARLLEGGEETRLEILVDVIFPRRLLHEALANFARKHPRARVQIFNASLNTMWDILRTGDYVMALALTASVPPDMAARAFGSYQLAPHCAAGHPLAAHPEPVPTAAFRAERQIYYVGAPDVELERVGYVLSNDIWTIDDVEQIRQLVSMGVGWCFGGAFTFEEEVKDGRIRRLVCEDSKFHPLRHLGVVWPLAAPRGILGESLTECVEEAARRRAPDWI